MNRNELTDLNIFATLAEELNFTRAAIRLETSQSALSHALKRLEKRLGVRLLARTTRQVTLTQAGEQLYKNLRPAFDSIAEGLNEVGILREKPSGLIRITAPPHAARYILWPVIREFSQEFPEVNFEINVDSGTKDIIAERFDAGVRLGELIANNMVAVRIGPDMQMVVVASPDYIQRAGAPVTPADLAAHNCINFRLPTSGGNYIWEFDNGREKVNVRVEGRLTFNDTDMIIDAAVQSGGIACLTAIQAEEPIRQGKLVSLLQDWCKPFPGYYLFYPERKNNSAAFRLFIERLRSQAQSTS
ncbi:LysR family transcriptional regulator [Dickeya zeae]|uniref:LysR family transcriptional regulator n=1 Tax=Dickeya zeae TaxID=204042 RepID=UPI001C63ADA8|nr:LysR family transcriptional regulator [Dickeya zeae]